MAMTLFSAWAVLLSKLSGQDDFAVGVPVANRPRPELESLIGFFVNTLPIRVSFEQGERITDVLRRLKGRLLGAYEHQYVPFEEATEDDLDVLLCDEVSDAAPLTRFLGRPLTPLDEAIAAAVREATRAAST